MRKRSVVLSVVLCSIVLASIAVANFVTPPAAWQQRSFIAVAALAFLAGALSMLQVYGEADGEACILGITDLFIISMVALMLLDWDKTPFHTRYWQIAMLFGATGGAIAVAYMGWRDGRRSPQRANVVVVMRDQPMKLLPPPTQKQLT